MRTLSEHIYEKLVINKNFKSTEDYKIENNKDFENYIREHIDVKSDVLDLSGLDFSRWSDAAHLSLINLRSVILSSSITTIDVSNWEFNDAHIDFSFLFKDLKNIQNIVGFETWRCKYAEHAEAMFSNCKSLQGRIDLSGVNFHLDHISFENMFNGCETITSVFLPESTMKVDNTTGMFFGCKKLIVIKNLNHIDTSKLYSCKSMFCNCGEIRLLNGIEKWDMSHVSNMSYMFSDASKVVLFDDLFKNWIIKRHANTEHIFRGTKYAIRELKTI